MINSILKISGNGIHILIPGGQCPINKNSKSHTHYDVSIRKAHWHYNKNKMIGKSQFCNELGLVENISTLVS